MQILKKGDQVREIGKTLAMTVCGDAGLTTISTNPGTVAESTWKNICARVNKKDEIFNTPL